MIRSLLLSVAFAATASAYAQDPLSQLAGGVSQQWTVVGYTPSAGPCKAGDAIYTFQAKPAQVVVKQCEGGTWKTSTEAITTWSAGGKTGVTFGGAKYEVKTLPSSAPACKGSANCVRLLTMPDGKTDATRTIYLTH
ncbi:MAG: hypothetical protein JNM62_08525 [Flavobacteriales bacterium]|nr:hypothetical protein [Flavobacteriales bacterium]